MAITVKLMAGFMERLPPEAEGNSVSMDSGGDLSAHAVMAHFGIPRTEVHLVLCDGKAIPPEARDDALPDGAELSLWPVLHGG